MFASPPSLPSLPTVPSCTYLKLENDSTTKRKAKTKHLPPANKKLRSVEDILMFLASSGDEDDSDDDGEPVVLEDT